MRLSKINNENLTDKQIDKIVFSNLEDSGKSSKYGIVFGSYTLQKYRIETALEMYNEGRVKKLILSGGSGGTSNKNNEKIAEADIMKKLLVEKGVNEQDLILENDNVSLVKVDMGEPILKADKIPVNNYTVEKSFDGELFVKTKINDYNFTAVSMGNPHAVTFVENVDNIDISKYGPEVENNPIFPNRTNVEFVQIIDKNNIKVRVWERGAGETKACGTGACAAVVASGLNGYTDENVTVRLPGGILKIEWGKDNHIYMQGPATSVFEGKIVDEV